MYINVIENKKKYSVFFKQERSRVRETEYGIHSL